MKKNKLAISAGILLIVSAGLSLLGELLILVLMQGLVQSVAGEIQLEYFAYYIESLTQLFMMMAKSTLFIVLGIMILRHGIKGVNPLHHKGLFVTTCVFAYIGAISSLSVTGILAFGTYLASAILLTKCLISANPSTVKISNSDKIDLGDSVSKIKALKNLKEEGVITEDQFNQYLQDIVSKMGENMADGEK